MNKRNLSTITLSVLVTAFTATPFYNASAQDAFGDNLPSFSDSFAPAIESTTIPREFETREIKQPPQKVVTGGKIKRKSEARLRRDVEIEALIRIRSNELSSIIAGAEPRIAASVPSDLDSIMQFADSDPKNLRKLAKLLTVKRTYRTPVKIRTVKQPPLFEKMPKARHGSIKYSSSTSANFVTNAFKSSKGGVDDMFISHAPSLIVLIPIGTKEDSLFFEAGTISNRYHDNPSLDKDLARSRVKYTTLLGANPTLPDMPDNGDTRETDTLTFAFDTLSVFDDTFDEHLNTLFKPSLLYAIRNYQVGSDYCKRGEKLAHCTFFDASAIVDTTWFRFDGRSNDNSSLKLISKVSHRLQGEDVTLALQASAHGRVFHRFPGGREDLELNVTASSALPLGNAGTFALGAGYTKQFSSVSAAEWEGFNAFASLSIKFGIHEFEIEKNAD